MELEGVVQNYAWGKIGSSSAVADLSTVKVDPDLTYAELWMGTHPNGPATLKGTGISLKDFIDGSENKAKVLGEECNKQFGGSLPFLLKVLSVNKALSIQAHPNKELAETLHEQRPDIYKDPNHKPEMALALTEFEGLCGFRPLGEIAKFLLNMDPLRNVVGESNAVAIVNGNADALKDAFGALMQCEPETIKSQLSSMLNSNYEIPYLKELFLRLHKEYPGDVGCFVIYFLNFVVLQPGESMFLGPNLPHAYLKGDCIECMACSDNVVRAGLTPKLIDVPTLLSMLDYQSVSNVKFSPVQENEQSLLYSPPVKDFSIVKICVLPGKKYTLLPRKSASILIYTTGTDVKGKIIFLKAEEIFEIQENQTDVLVFQAFCGC
uniref:Mannose-6-phosphate isomerase n=1 Tax=Lepeophtheirus salmonis TaxID=72036 RepID=A0A0K2V1E5_LEPSM